MSISAEMKPRIHYGWIVVGVTFFVLLVASGVRGAPSVLIVPLEQEFGWSRAGISLPISIGLLVYGIVGPFSAAFIDRFGMRKVVLSALVLLLIGFAPTVLITESWQLIPLWGLATGLGTGIAAMILAAMVSTRWFVKRRGLVMGLLTGAAAAGNLIFLPLLANVAVHIGWRWAVAIACVFVVLAIPVVALFLRSKPSDVGLAPYGAAADHQEMVIPRVNPITETISALGQGIASRDFWLLGGSFFVCGFSTLGLIGTHFIPACIDHGIPEATAAGIIAFMGIFNFIGTTASGWASDRFDSRYLLFWYYALRGVSLLFLPYAFTMSLWGLSLFGIFYGLDWIATVPPTVRLAANAFGPQRASIMYGWVMVCHQVGAAAAAYGAGLVHNLYGDYWSAFIFAGLLCFVAALLVLRIGTVSHTGRRPALAAA
ncbi:MAG TPA: MFS transporter [Stellaceae bacterium]